MRRRLRAFQTDILGWTQPLFRRAFLHGVIMVMESGPYGLL
ncbi:hypothetical protein [Azospirillum doebereinerae]